MRPLAATVRLNGCSAKIRRCASRSHVGRVERSETRGRPRATRRTSLAQPGLRTRAELLHGELVDEVAVLAGKASHDDDARTRIFLVLVGELAGARDGRREAAFDLPLRI